MNLTEQQKQKIRDAVVAKFQVAYQKQAAFQGKDVPDFEDPYGHRGLLGIGHWSYNKEFRDRADQFIDKYQSNPNDAIKWLQGYLTPEYDNSFAGGADAYQQSAKVGNDLIGQLQDELNTYAAPEQTPEQISEKEKAAARQSTTDKIRAYGEAMLKDFDANDPQVKKVTAVAADIARRQAQDRGFGRGGLGLRHVENAVSNALVDVQQQRNQLGLQALTNAGNLDLGAMAAYDRAYQTQLQALQAQYQQQQQRNQAQGALVGGAGGAILEKALNMPGLSQTGSQLFAGGFGAMTPSYSMPSYSPPVYGYGYGNAPYGGLGSGSNYRFGGG